MERISLHTEGESRKGHEVRYRMAAGFVSPGDTVLDAACGIGYGSEILSNLQQITYVGVDNYLDDVYLEDTSTRKFLREDLLVWEPDFEYDVFVGFETIEHLPSYAHYISLAKQARNWILVSTPNIPTVHMNPHHLHDFEPGDLRKLFEDSRWDHYQTFQQPSEVSEVSIFRRRL